MRPPGIKNVIEGLIFFGAGIGVTLVTYTAASRGGYYILAYGAVLGGIFQFLYGVTQYVSYTLKGPEEKKLIELKVIASLLLRSLLYIASSNGKVESSQVEKIIYLFHQLISIPIESNTVQGLLEKIDDEETLKREIENLMSLIDTEQIYLVIRGCYALLKSSQTIPEESYKRFSFLLKEGGLPHEQQEEILQLLIKS